MIDSCLWFYNWFLSENRHYTLVPQKIDFLMKGIEIRFMRFKRFLGVRLNLKKILSGSSVISEEPRDKFQNKDASR